MKNLAQDPVPGPSLGSELDLNDPMEQQLQRELLSMFEVDSQRDLEQYLQMTQQLCPENWKQDISSLYRAIHTIKGGAVTVRAEGALVVATVLEDLLSDLRYLEAPPVLSDGQLQASLQEAGELLAIALSASNEPDHGVASAIPLVAHLNQLRQTIQTTHVGEWDAQAQLRQEFIQDGFDLVVLDLEMALRQLETTELVDPASLHAAEQVLEELDQIGVELEMPSAWAETLAEARLLLSLPEAEIWRSHWPDYLQRLKASLQSPQPSSPQPSSPQPSPPFALPEPLPAPTSASAPILTPEPNAGLSSGFGDSFGDGFGASLDALANLSGLMGGLGSAESDPEQPVVPIAAEPVAEPERRAAAETVHVPIPLERLEKSAQAIVETILAARTTTDTYQALQAQINQILAIAQDSSQFAAQLRQLQDDYALLDNHLKGGMAEQLGGPTPERYRKGYITINRLLEMNLRLSEVGAEAEQTARQTGVSLQSLDRELLSLKDSIEANQLIPFKNVAFRVRAIVRELSHRSDKNQNQADGKASEKDVRLTVEGESLEIDVRASRQLEPALLHLIRNAFDHGLETTAERLAQGKPAQGQLRLSLKRQGSRLVLQLQDDGRGIDPQAVQQRARSLALPLSQTDSAETLLAVLCQPGFSSQTEVSELSGRGVGMDVVAEQVARLGGSLTLETQLGQGTTFSLSLPLPRLLEPCLLAQAGSHLFAIPTDQVVMSQVISQLVLEPTTPGDSGIEWRVKDIAGDRLAIDLLGDWQPELNGRPLPETAIALEIRPAAASDSFYLLADKLLGQQDLAIERFPKPLLAPRGILGLSLQPNGTLVPVLDGSADLIAGRGKGAAGLSGASRAGAGHAGAEPRSPQPTTSESSVPTLLIVDDAALMRRRLSASLTAYGYRVETCADGLEAWNWLRSHPQPALMITDIEMPYLDGFSLTDRCRKAGMTQPILVISSRLAAEWSMEASRVGATDFLTKGFSTSELLRKVEELLTAQVL